MSTTNFVDLATVIEADWLNDVNDHAYDETTVAHSAVHISNTPAGGLTATTVQAALNELDTGKQAYDVDTTKNDVSNTFVPGQTFTGAITANGGITNSDAETLNISSATSQSITLSPGGTVRVTATSDGRLFGSALHNNAGSVTGATNQYIASGTYTPTITNGANVTANTPRKCQWMRVGNVVTVSGGFDATVTSASVSTIVYLSLPIASSFTTTYEAGGMVQARAAAADTGMIEADATNDRAQVNWLSTLTSNRSFIFNFTYEIL